jgi:putative colanic acid biosynthesis acetyltransferase WcaF
MFDLAANRAAQKWTFREKLGRVLWAAIQPLFRMSPRPLWGWRRFLLRLFGAKIAAGVHIHPTTRITIPWNVTIGHDVTIGDLVIIYALGPIEIGPRSTISQYAHLCAGTHDWRDPAMPLLKLPIRVGADVWVCADAFIGPGVVIGDRAIIGARSVVMKDVAQNSVGHGNPFRVSKFRTPSS